MKLICLLQCKRNLFIFYLTEFCLTRSSRTEPPDLASLMKTTDEIIESLVCPPPPSESSLNEEMISSMIVPAPSWSKQAMSGPMSVVYGGIPSMNMGSMNSMGSVGAMSHGYNCGVTGYGMTGVMMQQGVPHGMMHYGELHTSLQFTNENLQIKLNPMLCIIPCWRRFSLVILRR